MIHRTPTRHLILSFFLRFLVCFLIVATTSVLAALAWDQSDNAAPESSTPNRPDVRGTLATPGR